MIKALLAKEQAAKTHVIAAHQMKTAVFNQLSNFDLPLNEWERLMGKLHDAVSSLEGRYGALWELRRDVGNSPAIGSDYARMRDDWYKYYRLSTDLAEGEVA